MSLRKLFVLFLLFQLPVYALVMYLTWDTNTWLFYLSEVLLVADIAAAMVFFRKVMTPISALTNGMGLLKGQDWNVALARVGQKDVDEIVEVFNRMIHILHDLNVANREQRHFLSLLVEESPVGIIVCGFDGRIKAINPSARRYFTGNDSFDCRMEDLHGALAAHLSMMASGANSVLRLGDGLILSCSCRSFMENGVRNSFYIVDNISEAVDSAEKEAYGKLIRLISHEVNNTVAGLTTALDTISAVLPADYSEESQLAASCSARAVELSLFIGRYAQVVKLPDPVLVRVDLGELVAAQKPFLESVCHQYGVAIRFENAEGIVVRADAAMIGQVLLNIVKNSCESIGGRADGEVLVSVSKTAPELVVRDNGSGIDAAKAEKIFMPFFTDKSGGQGIGLTLVREILRRHGASFNLATSSDSYTRFSIWF